MNLTAATKSKIVILSVLALFIYLLYGFFTKPKEKEVNKVVENINIDNSNISNQKKSSDNNLDSSIEKFIMDHPEVIIKSIENMQQKNAAIENNRIKEIIISKKSELENLTTSPFAGNKEGKTKIIVFYDYNCSYCKKLNSVINELIAKKPDVQVIYKQFPILSESSIYAAKSALAVYYNAPEKFIKFHEIIINSKSSIDRAFLESAATEVGLKYSDIAEQMDKTEVKDELSRIFAIAANININAVPVLIVNDQLFSGLIPLEKLEEMIDPTNKK